MHWSGQTHTNEQYIHIIIGILLSYYNTVQNCVFILFHFKFKTIILVVCAHIRDTQEYRKLQENDMYCVLSSDFSLLKRKPNEKLKNKVKKLNKCLFSVPCLFIYSRRHQLLAASACVVFIVAFSIRYSMDGIIGEEPIRGSSFLDHSTW